MSNWYVYILWCADGSLYTGITRDLERRLAEHNEGGRAGARYTRGRRPVKLVYSEEADSQAAAARREAEIKALSRLQKERLVSGAVPPDYTA
jgi:putative endonuclease